ncbi:REP-associated tyrosine transposase [Luteibacter yeojuensis]|uniref:REP-associated tyrosine transposase n=1 Tax=Luteibacter yeojuensis TaxID=345309 RepID=UPI003D18C07E
MTCESGQIPSWSKRVSGAGPIHLVTFVTWNRAPIFGDYRAARAASRIIHSHKTWRRAQCLAWILMPDHLHVLIRLDDVELSKVLARARSRMTRALRAQGRTFPLWQRAFQDRVLARDADARAVARFVVANAVRAGLVSHVGLYPYWNAVWMNERGTTQHRLVPHDTRRIDSGAGRPLGPT